MLCNALLACRPGHAPLAEGGIGICAYSGFVRTASEGFLC